MRGLNMKGIMLLFIFSFGLTAVPVLAGTVSNFEGIGYGTVVEPFPTDCQFMADGCTGTTEGTVKGEQIGNGTFTNTITVLWLNGFQNSNDEYCAPASGIVTITAADRSTLTIERTGIICGVSDGTIVF